MSVYYQLGHHIEMLIHSIRRRLLWLKCGTFERGYTPRGRWIYIRAVAGDRPCYQRLLIKHPEAREVCLGRAA